MSDGFIQAKNDFLTDKRLGLGARVLAMYWANKPEGWVIQESDAHKQLGIGSAAYKTAMRDLKKYGYVRAGDTCRDPKGRIRTTPPTIFADKVKPQVTPKVAYRTSVTDTSVVGPVTNTENDTDRPCSRCNQVAELRLWVGLDAEGKPTSGMLCQTCYSYVDAQSKLINRQSPAIAHPLPDARATANISVSPAATATLAKPKTRNGPKFLDCSFDCGRKALPKYGDMCENCARQNGQSDDY